MNQTYVELGGEDEEEAALEIANLCCQLASSHSSHSSVALAWHGSQILPLNLFEVLALFQFLYCEYAAIPIPPTLSVHLLGAGGRSSH